MEQTNNSKLRTEYNQKIIETEQQIKLELIRRSTSYVYDKRY